MPFIDYIAQEAMIVSTGMSLPNEIEQTVKLIKKYKTPLAITHCISAYPCPYEIMNLDFISELSKKYKIPVGLSDHTPSIYNALGAVSLGASIIEKHFTFNKKLSGPDHKSSIDSDELRILVDGAKANYLARENKKFFHKRKKLSNGQESLVVSIRNIKKGEKLNLNNISTKDHHQKRSIPANKFKYQLEKINRDIKKIQF